MTDPVREAAMERLKKSVTRTEIPPPCPFCMGSDIAVLESEKHRYFVICRGCRARTADAETGEKALRLWRGRRLD